MESSNENNTLSRNWRKSRGNSVLPRRALALVAGLAALGLMIELVASGVRTPVNVLWFWPGNLIVIFESFGIVSQMPTGLLRHLIGETVAHLFAVIASFRLARRINRHSFDWALFAFLLPPVAILLSFLPTGKADQDRWGGVMGRILFAFMSLTGLSQKCGKCGKAVPLYMTKGESCPHCGVVWTKEKTVHERFPGESDMHS